jgi:PAS domain S-box-containing protein
MAKVWARILRSPDVRILAIMLAGIAVFGVVDGSLWKSLATPTIAYRPAILFALTLVFGWRGFLWSQLLLLASFGAFYGWRGAALLTPLFLLSHALGLGVARRLGGDEPGISRERSTLGFLAGAALAPAVPALLGAGVFPLVGIKFSPAVPAALDSWLRGIAGILALSPALLVYCSVALREWVGLPSSNDRPKRLTSRNVLEVGVETAAWTGTLWLSVYFRQHYGLDITYLAFLAPLSFTLFRGMELATLTLVTNALIASTLWLQLHWSDALSSVDLRLLITTYSTTILVLAAVVKERQRGRGKVAKLLIAEAALRESEERYRLAIKATNDAIWDMDLKAGIITRNDIYCALYGGPQTENSWQFWIDRVHPEDRARAMDGFQTAVSGDASSWSGLYRFRRVDGKWAHIYDRAYIARDESGNAWRVIGSMQDLTEQKQAEAALRESEERFRRVFEEGPLGLALVGKDFRFRQVNNALCQMVGYSEAELRGKTFVDITHPDDVSADVDLAARLFKREIPFFRIQKRYVKKTGEIIWINLTASTILDADGELLHGLAMVEDITEMKRSQEEALFRQKLESLGTLAGGIAHDFNNILGAVQAQSELAQAELDGGSSCRNELKAIGEVAMRGSEIVRQLMIYAGTESGAVELVDLSKTVDEMLALLRVSVTKHAVIKADLDADLPAIFASAAQVRQVVMNLITNASDAIGDRDGVIRVSTRHVTLIGESAAISSRTLPDGHYVQLEVSDTGRGMSLETQANVFDPFFTTKSAGRGLGLAVVQGIVRSLGGAIRLTSELDKGTTFQMLLPCTETTAAGNGRVIPGVRAVAAPTRNCAVLVVEDEGNLRQPVVKILSKNGFEVFEAADGTSAIDLLRAHGTRIDTVLLDMTLPGPSTREIIAAAVNAKPDIRVILTSAYSREIIEASMSAPQIRSFIRKPFQFGDLLEVLRSSLSS